MFEGDIVGTEAGDSVDVGKQGAHMITDQGN
jgi:hypothetical protein